MGASDPPTRAPRSLLRRIALWVGVAVAVFAALAVLGIPLPLAPFVGTIETAASEALGRPLSLGSARLVLGIHPHLAVEELRLAHGVSGRPDVLRVERLDLELGLLALFQRRLHVRRAEMEGVDVSLDPEAFPARESGGADDEQEATPSDASPWTLDVDRLVLSRIEAELRRPDEEPTRASLDELSASLLWDESLELAFSGRYEDVPLAARIEGASVADLLAGTEAWPLRLALDLAGSEIELGAQLATLGDVYRIDGIEGRAEDTSVAGWLQLEGLPAKPRASGRIDVGAIQLELPEREETGAAVPEEPAAAAEPGAGRRLPGLLQERAEDDGPGPMAALIGLLHDFETDLEVRIERIAGIGPTVEELELALRVSGGELRFPVSMTAAEIPLSGTLLLDEVEGVPHLGFELAAERFRVDSLAEVLAPNAKIAGPFEQLRLELEGRGNSLLGFLTTLRIELAAADAALTYGEERAVPFGVERLELSLPEGGDLSLEARGDLLGQAVSLDLSGGGVEALLGEAPWALRIEARGAGATIELSGEAIGFLADAQLLGTLRIHGEELARLEPWVGPLPVPDAPYSIEARIDDTTERSQVELVEVSLGDVTLTGDFGQRREGDTPVAWANLRIARLDLSPFLEDDGPQAAADPDPPRADERGDGTGDLGFESPILPGGIKLVDADLDLGIGALVLGARQLGDLRFQGSFREGYLPDSSFGFRLGGAAFDGAISMDLRDPPHSATFEFGARDVDVGALLAELDFARGAAIRAGGLRIEVRGEGATLGDILERSGALVRLEDVRWTLRDSHSDTDVPLVLKRGELTLPPGDAPTRLVAEGSFRDVPAQLTLETRDLAFLKRMGDRVPVDLRFEMAGATLEVASELLLPIDRKQLEIEVTLEGQSLARASALFDYELPPIGPYRLASRMQLTQNDYRLSDLQLRVGRSQLRGSGRLDTRGARPRIDLDLRSDRLQLDDFEALAGERADADGEAAAPTHTRDVEDGGEPREFFSPEGLQGFDGRVAVKVGKVLSGKDDMGRGELVATLRNGRLEVDPLHIELPGGPFDLRMGYAYTGGDVEARISAFTERFDFGILARRLDPETDMKGWLGLDLDIEGRAPEISTLLAHASGHLDFLAAPENIETDLVDLWAVNLLSFILPRLDSGPRSTLNCLVARFGLDDGIMTERALLLDTTQMLVTGDATVDFGEERVHAVLTPQPKKPEFLSLQTRVEVKGSFDDFDLDVPPEELVATVIRFVTSVVTVPLQRIFMGRLPADGEETCWNAWTDAESGERTAARARRPVPSNAN